MCIRDSLRARLTRRLGDGGRRATPWFGGRSRDDALSAIAALRCRTDGSRRAVRSRGSLAWRFAAGLPRPGTPSRADRPDGRAPRIAPTDRGYLLIVATVATMG